MGVFCNRDTLAGGPLHSYYKIIQGGTMITQVRVFEQQLPNLILDEISEGSSTNTARGSSTNTAGGSSTNTVGGSSNNMEKGSSDNMNESLNVSTSERLNTNT
ncbi:16904_t:CDS:2, partial [Gigaspora margarita]